MRRVRIAAVVVLQATVLYAQSPSETQQAAHTALQFEQNQTGHDCPDAATTLDINSCMAQVVAKTKANLAVLIASVRTLLGKDPEVLRLFDRSQQQWDRYASVQCDAVDSFYRTGTIRFAAVTGCTIRLTRSRMQDVDAIYYDTLHN